MFRPVFLFILFLLLGAMPGYGQQYNFRQYSLEEGLPQSEVISLVQDKKGNIWVGTNGGGISRFNGKTFQTFNRKHGLADNNIRVLFQDSKENLWIGTSQGVTMYNGISFRNYTTADSLPQAIYFRILEDTRGRIWALGAGQGVNHISYLENGIFHDLVQEQTDLLGEDNQVLFIYLDRKGILYLTCQKGLYFLKGDKLKISPLNQHAEFKNLPLVPIFEDDDDRLWVRTFEQGYGTRIFKIEEGKPVELPIPEQISRQFIGNLFMDSQQRIWMSIFNTGVAVFEGDQVKILDDRRGLNSPFVNVIQEDQEGNIWMATSGEGVIKYSANKFLSLNFTKQIGSNMVRGIFQDSRDAYWFAIAGKGVVQFKDNEMQSYTPEDHRGLLNIRDFHELPNGNLLMAGFNGIIEFDGKTFREVSSRYGLPNNTPVIDICLTKKGLWLATFGRGAVLVRKDNSTQSVTAENHGLITNQIISANCDNKENVWFCHYQGASKFDGDTVINYNQTNGLNDNWVLQATQDSLGRFWLATYSGGINIWDSKADKWEYLTTEQGITSDNVYSILCDKEGSIWAGTQNGVDRITYDRSGKITSIRNYNKYDGFTGIENNGAGNYIDRYGNLWFGTINGAMMFSPSKDQMNPNPPIIQLTDIKLFFRKVNWRDEQYSSCLSGVQPWFPLPQDLRLPYYQRHLTFNFEALSYKAPEKVKYQWKLKGLDKNWSPITSKNEATYSNIPPGEYTFLVKASNSDGVWTPNPYEYSFVIRPPWWNIWWVKGIGVLLLASLIFLGVRIRIRNIQAKKKELEQLVKQKTAEVLRQKNEIEKKNQILEDQKTEILNQAENLQQSYENLKHLSDIGKVITTHLSSESIIDTVYETVNELMDASVFGVGIYFPESNSLLFPRIKEKGRNLDAVEFALEDISRLAVHCFQNQEEIVIRDLQKEYHKYIPRIIPVEKTGTPKSVIYLPLHSQEKVIGVITVQSFEANAYLEYHVNLLRNIAVYASIALQNASAYRQIEEQTKHLKKANKNIQKQKEEIENKNNELLELNIEKNHLIGIIAHDLKNPLTSTLTIAQYLKKEMENNERYEEMENVEYMLKALVRMNEMVSKILDIPVIEAKQLNLNLERTNLAKLMETVNRNFKNTLKKKNLNLNLDCQNVYANVDPNYMTQIYENLISNAIKFSPTDRNIWVKVWEEGERVRTMVKDEGPGLTHEDQKKLFGKFQVLSAKPTAGEKSTGLGLSIVKKYVEAMKGKVWCESEPGKGANFIVELQKA